MTAWSHLLKFGAFLLKISVVATVALLVIFTFFALVCAYTGSTGQSGSHFPFLNCPLGWECRWCVCPGQDLFLPLTRWLLVLEHLLDTWLGLGTGWMDCSTVSFSLCLSPCPQLPHCLRNSDLHSAWRSPVLWRACRQPCQRSTGTTNCSRFTARVKTWFGDEAATRASEPLLINHMMGRLKMTMVGDEEAVCLLYYFQLWNDLYRYQYEKVSLF